MKRGDSIQEHVWTTPKIISRLTYKRRSDGLLLVAAKNPHALLDVA